MNPSSAQTDVGDFFSIDRIGRKRFFALSVFIKCWPGAAALGDLSEVISEFPFFDAPDRLSNSRDKAILIFFSEFFVRPLQAV
jgi:hypothetical protein